MRPDTPISLRSEAVIALVVTAYSVVLGGALGLVWPRVAPHLDVGRAVQFSEAAAKALLGDDLWLGLLGIAFGALSVALLTVTSRTAGHGPGAMIGLAAGGVLGSLIAVHVGEHIQQPHVRPELVAAFTHAYPGITASTASRFAGYFDFAVRAKAVLLAWPIAAVLLQAGVVIARSVRSAGISSPVVH